MAVAPRSGRSVVGWAAIVLSFVLIAVSVVLLSTAQQGSVSDQQETESVAEGELFEARRTLELATLEVVAMRMLDGVDVEGDRSARLAAASDVARLATLEISRLAGGPGVSADEAAALLDDLDVQALEDPTAADLSDLFVVAEDVARYSGASDVVTTRRQAIHQLSFVSTLPLHVLIEGIAADVSVNERLVDPEAEIFVEEVIEVVRSEGGWFGADAAAPLVDSIWIELDEAGEFFPTAIEGVTALIAASDVVEYDAWMRELRAGDASPPFELADMVQAADELQPGLVGVIDQLVIDDELERAVEVAEQRSNRGFYRIAAAASAFLALLGFAFGASSISRGAREARHRAELATRDALTGIGNRYELEERTRHLAMDSRFKQHAVVMIDFDFFKLVNDVHGHAAGDAILVEVASRLQNVVDRLESDGSGLEATVVRLGGDEFLLTVHAVEPLDTDWLGAELDAIREDSIDFDGERLGLGFSIGVVLVDGQNDLDSLMGAADLAVYQDKASRARTWKPSDSGLSSPQ